MILLGGYTGTFYPPGIQMFQKIPKSETLVGFWGINWRILPSPPPGLSLASSVGSYPAPGAVSALPKWIGVGSWKEHPKGELGILGGIGCWALLELREEEGEHFPICPINSVIFPLIP